MKETRVFRKKNGGRGGDEPRARVLSPLSSMVRIIAVLRVPFGNSTLQTGIDSSLSANFSLKPRLDLSARFMQLRGTPVSHLY